MRETERKKKESNTDSLHKGHRHKKSTHVARGALATHRRASQHRDIAKSTNIATLLGSHHLDTGVNMSTSAAIAVEGLPSAETYVRRALGS